MNCVLCNVHVACRVSLFCIVYYVSYIVYCVLRIAYCVSCTSDYVLFIMYYVLRSV